jgi:L-glyceraldehyde 3-phosphate reductase
MTALPHRQLGSSGIDVSVLALGSWQTYERIPRETGAAVLRRARQCGIDFLEVARYDDQTGTAPLRTGHSEVVFGEIFRASGWPRDEVVIANKLWWEFFPEQTAAQELDASLGRTGLDRFDFLYSDPPPAALPMEEVVRAVGELVTSGRVRGWGVVNWPAGRIAEAGRAAAALGVPGPSAAQLVYNVVRRSVVEKPEMLAVLASCGTSVVASWTLGGGTLTGKYAAAGANGRYAGSLDMPRVQQTLAAADRLRSIAAGAGTTPAAMAIAFALSRPVVATVLCGATGPDQVAENAQAADALAGLDEARLAELERLAGEDA